MPHHFKTIARDFPLATALVTTTTTKESHSLRWEAINSAAYLTGGILFVIGSIFFLPRYADYINVGSYLFVVGSILYLIVSGHDLHEELHSSKTLGDNAWGSFNLIACAVYIVGATVFIVGSVLFLPGVQQYTGGALCFIAGSILFVVGAIMNALQIFQGQTAWNMQAMLVISLCYVVGSTLFVVASIPYLFTFQAAADEERVYRFLGAQYIAGSVFFLIGGTVNYYRARQTTLQKLGSPQQALIADSDGQ